MAMFYIGVEFNFFEHFKSLYYTGISISLVQPRVEFLCLILSLTEL